MPVSVVVGGQYGSEGKGKVAEWLARRRQATFAIRVGGPNSGHTVIDGAGKAWTLRQLPTAAILPEVTAVIGAGSMLDVSVLLDEIKRIDVEPTRLFIHPRAVVIEEADKLAEGNELIGRIGSTGTGTGNALSRRVERQSGVRFASDIPELQRFVKDATDTLARASASEWIIVEGTQGFGLSLLYGSEYPYVTSRDTTAAAFLSEAGLSPLVVEEVALVIRAHPIRVAGNSGPLKDEIDWRTVSIEGRLQQHIEEFTTVTKRLRRVGRFDADVVRKAIAHNLPTSIVLNHLDYIAASDREDFVQSVERSVGREVDWIGLSADLVTTRRSLRKAG